MFPEGAFDEYAARGSILVAENQTDGTLAGYLLYRVSSTRVSIAHLCVAENQRGRGVSRALFESLKQAVDGEPGISVRCRQDFPANAIWPHLGFVWHGEMPGRGSDRATVVQWWYNLAHTTLWAEAAKQVGAEKIGVVMDANVLFDQIEGHEPKAEASQALLADWLEESIELVVTDEVFNEINRRQDSDGKTESLALASKFHCLPCEGNEFERWQSELRPLFPVEMTEQDESDLRQVARAIGGGAQYMVTRDGPLLDRAADVEEAAGLRILHPADLITKLDELRRENVYQPARFLGSSIAIRAVRGEDADPISAALVQTTLGEGQKSLRGKLRGLVSKPDQHNSRVILIGTKPVGCLVTWLQRGAPDVLAVPLIRAATGPSASTLARQFVRLVVREACEDQLPIIRIEDEHTTPELQAALYDFGFVQTLTGWVKVNLYGGITRQDAAAQLRSYATCDDLFDQGAEEWADAIDAADPYDVAAGCEDECRLWPVKFSDVDVPCYIIPIQPRWAAELFDDRLAAQGLFCRRADLAINVEAVYYRSAHGIRLDGPARVLWYVSGDGPTDGTMQIRACSYLYEATVGKPKLLFRRFKRLGIYEWSQVYETAKHDIDTEIMAIRFGRTQLLPSPITFHRAQELLGKGNQFQGPLRIDSDIFIKMYNEADR